MSAFGEAIAKLLPIEGGYSNNPDDSGGKTAWGITEDVARANGYEGLMWSMPVATAKRIYKAQYWDTLFLDDCPSTRVAHEMFDTGVNCGIGVAGEFLQRALNALNRKQRDYPDMKVDGVPGPVTQHALRKFLEQRGDEGEAVLLKALNCLQGARYVRLAEQREKDETFLYGWLKQRIEL